MSQLWADTPEAHLAQSEQETVIAAATNIGNTSFIRFREVEIKRSLNCHLSYILPGEFGDIRNKSEMSVASESLEYTTEQFQLHP